MHARVLNLGFGYGESFETITEASDLPEGHEQGVGAVGGQEALQGVKF